LRSQAGYDPSPQRLELQVVPALSNALRVATIALRRESLIMATLLGLSGQVGHCVGVFALAKL